MKLILVPGSENAWGTFIDNWNQEFLQLLQIAIRCCWFMDSQTLQKWRKTASTRWIPTREVQQTLVSDAHKGFATQFVHGELDFIIIIPTYL
jgi:hypothetical protein